MTDALAAAHRLLAIEESVMPKPPPGIMADAFVVARALVGKPLAGAAIYTPDQARVAAYITKASGENVGGGDDPVGFLIASHAALVDAERDKPALGETGR